MCKFVELLFSNSDEVIFFEILTKVSKTYTLIKYEAVDNVGR